MHNFPFRLDGTFRNVLTLLSGTVVAHAIGIFATPVLTRLYSPEHFGTVALYSSLITILSAIVSWRYEMAIVLPESDDDAAHLVFLAIALALGFSTLVLVIVALLRLQVAQFVGAPLLARWLWIAPIHLIIIAICQTLNYWSTRKEFYAYLSTSRIVQSLVRHVFAIGTGLISKADVLGLLMGQFLGDIANFGALTGQLIKSKRACHGVQRIYRYRLTALARQYIDIPLNALPTAFLNAVSSNVIPLVVSYCFGAFATGLIAFAQTLLMTPLNVITRSIWQVTFAKLPQRRHSDRVELFSRVHRSVALLCAFPLTGAALFGAVCGKIFGSQWQNLQYILPAIALMVYVNSISNSTSYFVAFGYYRLESMVNVILLLVRLVSLVVGGWLFDFYVTVNIYALSSTLVYMGVNLIWARRFEKIREYSINLFMGVLLAILVLLPIRLFCGDNLGDLIPFFLCASVVYYAIVWKMFGRQLLRSPNLR